MHLLMHRHYMIRCLLSMVIWYRYIKDWFEVRNGNKTTVLEHISFINSNVVKTKISIMSYTRKENRNDINNQRTYFSKYRYTIISSCIKFTSKCSTSYGYINYLFIVHVHFYFLWSLTVLLIQYCIHYWFSQFTKNPEKITKKKLISYYLSIHMFKEI